MLSFDTKKLLHMHNHTKGTCSQIKVPQNLRYLAFGKRLLIREVQKELEFVVLLGEAFTIPHTFQLDPWKGGGGGGGGRGCKVVKLDFIKLIHKSKKKIF